jgi:hypothetical protein
LKRFVKSVVERINRALLSDVARYSPVQKGV